MTAIHEEAPSKILKFNFHNHSPTLLNDSQYIRSRGIHSLLIGIVFFSIRFFTIQQDHLERRLAIDTVKRKKRRRKKLESPTQHSGVLKTGTFRGLMPTVSSIPRARGWTDAIPVPLLYFLFPGARQRDSEEKKAKREEKLKRGGNHSG